MPFKKGYKQTEEHKKHLKENHKGTLGKHWKMSNETKLKMSLASKGKPKSEEHKKALSKARMGRFYGEKSSVWKGNNVGYFSLHAWVERWKGKPNKCEKCGTETAKKYEWANIDHTYKRVLEDYIRMCTSCHRCYDRDMGIKINKFL